MEMCAVVTACTFYTMLTNLEMLQLGQCHIWATADILATCSQTRTCDTARNPNASAFVNSDTALAG